MAMRVAKIALESIKMIATSENFVQERHGVIWFTGLLVGTVLSRE